MFRARTRNELRESLLDGLRTRFAATGHRLLATPRTWTYRLADALGVELEGVEAALADLVREVWPTTASPEGIARHASVHGVPRRPAVSAHLRVRVTGPASVLSALPAGRKLSSSRGASFTPAASSVTFDGAGLGWLEVVADASGDAGNLPAGTVLTWSAAPAGFGPTAMVAAGPGDTTANLSAGEDEETLPAWALRIVARLQERPGSGNRADWREQVEAVDGVGEAYVYPRTNPADFARDTLGCVTVIALAPKPSSYTQNADGTLPDGLRPWTRFDAPRSVRACSNELLTRVRRYLRGECDMHGAEVPEPLRVERFAASMDPSGWDVRNPTAEALVSVRVAVQVDPALYRWAFTTPPLLLTAATDTTLTFSAGDFAAANFREGSQLALPLGEGVIRGVNHLVRVTHLHAATNTITIAPRLPVVPAAGTAVYPDCGLWDAIRRELLTLYDAMGPAPFVTGTSQRYPPESYRGPSTFYVGQVYAAVMRVPGVINATVLHPTATVTPAPGAIVVPGEIRIQPMA